MKIRRILSVFLLTVLMVSLMLTPQAYALPALEIKAKAAVLVDADEGRIIFGQNEQEREYPASITKVMTALLTLEAVDAGKLSLDQPITASAVVNDQDPEGSSAGIEEGEVLTVEQLLYCLLLVSANEAADILAAWVEEQPEAGEFSRFDLLLDGSYTAWLRFANSLRMRLAVRIAVAAPEKARAEFRKAAQAAGGVIETSMENAAVKTSGTYSNPLGEINLNWNEAALNASMESVLTGYGDPRLEKFFKPCGSDVVIAGDAGDGTVVLKGQYHGIRQGTGFSHNYYAAFSRLTVDTDTDAVLMTAAEVWFLRAEAALRGWTDEDAERCYRNGVAASFAQWQLSGAESYLGSDAMAADYHDPVDPGNDIAARCRVSPRWDATADDELKLERIITQKWIAMYPEGCEAWAEQRRTGYPRLFPVRLNHSKGYIDTETMIRRLPFPAALATSDPEQYASLVAELGGEDHGGTRLWWDAGRNF